MKNEIHLMGNLYAVYLSMRGVPFVIVQRGKYLWRVASAEMTAKVLKGLQLSVVRV
jgi:hypothetical protein